MINTDFNFIYHPTNIVMSLSKGVLLERRCIYVDDWYSFVELLDELGKRCTGVIGIVRKDGKALPKDAVNEKIVYSPQYNPMCMQWKDKRDFCMLFSTIPDEEGKKRERSYCSVSNQYLQQYDGWCGSIR